MHLNPMITKNLQSLGLETCVITGSTFIDFNKPINSKSMLNNNSSNGNKKLCANFKLTKNNQEIFSKLCGQKCRTLIALIENKNKGITALEVSCWAFRLAAYIHILRSKFDLNIITKNEVHDGGFHARYYLLDQVEILGGKND